MHRLWHISRIKSLKLLDQPPLPPHWLDGHTWEAGKEVKTFLSFPIFFLFPFLCCFSSSPAHHAAMGRKPCHDAGAVVRWMTTPGQHGEGPRLHVKRRRHSRLGPHNKVVLGPSPLAGYSVGKCHSKLARHKGLKYFRGSGTTRATRPRQSAWSHLWALCGETGLHSLPSVPQEWTFLFRLLCVHFFHPIFI